MSRTIPLRACCFACFVIFGLNFGAGCIPTGTTPDPILDGNTGVDPNAYPGRHVQGEPDDNFNQPIEILFDSNGQAQLQGTLPTVDDVDVYTLGALKAGDRIVVDVGHSGDLDADVAIFDVNGDIAFENDDRDPDLNQLDPFLNVIVRHDSPIYYLAITSAPLNPTTGGYDINVSLAPGGTVPSPVPQKVFLNFAGGTITIPGERTYTVGPFNTAEIDPAYTGMTQWVENTIADTVRKDFEGLSLTVQVSPPAALPTDCSASIVLFGGVNPGAFGTSQDVDPYNVNPCDQTIIFTGMFTPARFGRTLSGTELGTAIGNIAAHEIGHLLGLNHVDAFTDLMDTTGGPETFFNQQFETSPLDWTIFPFGQQDGVQLLLETIGGTRQNTP